jgi:excisionase family DNA binding protein
MTILNKKGSSFMKPVELAKILNVSPEAVRTWIFHKKIPVKRFGRAVRIPIDVAECIIREGLKI